MSPVWIRRALVLSVMAAVAWATVSITSLIEREPEDYIDAMVLVPFALTCAGFLCLHQLQRDALSRTWLGRISTGMSALALACLLIGQASIVAGSDRLLWLGFPAGALGWLVGFACYGYATARAGVLPAKIGLGLAIAEPVTIVMGMALSPIAPLADGGNFSGAIGHSAIWLGIAWLLYGLAAHRRQEPSLATI